MSSQWIDIYEYAARYGVSPSTLRRRIRSRTINSKMERGKYMLQDSPETLGRAPLYARMNSPLRQSINEKPEANDSLLAENRRLKQQISELETLVKALESELSSTPTHG